MMKVFPYAASTLLLDCDSELYEKIRQATWRNLSRNSKESVKQSEEHLN